MRRGCRARRSVERDEVEGRVVLGRRVSLEIVARRPRWVGVETRVLKAVRRSWDAGGWVGVSYLTGLLEGVWEGLFGSGSSVT